MINLSFKNPRDLFNVKYINQIIKIIKDQLSKLIFINQIIKNNKDILKTTQTNLFYNLIKDQIKMKIINPIYKIGKYLSRLNIRNMTLKNN